tara:strand:- start:595 stop:4101 length:3507 start_codon:yes stop_codon:yes gene_type:complete
MGFFGGLKKIGKGIGRGVKKIGRGIDKFDDLIKLKELASIGKFIPGVNVIAKPLSMVYSGYDLAKGIKDRDLGSIIGAGVNLAGTHGIKTSGFGGGIGGGGLSLGKSGDALSKFGQATMAPLANRGFGSQILSNLGSFTGGARNPFGQLSKLPGIGGTIGKLTSQYKDLDPMTQDLIKGIGGGVGAAMLSRNAQQSQQGSGGGYMPYAPMSYGSLGMQGMAHGGISGDWHEPINMLPPNYEGWVDKPSIATLGESGSEAVLPLNKLVPAMRQGGLNYSPGQAIVGEAGPEYITGLRPGQEDWARSILNVPAMQTGGVASGFTTEDIMRNTDPNTAHTTLLLRALNLDLPYPLKLKLQKLLEEKGESGLPDWLDPETDWNAESWIAPYLRGGEIPSAARLGPSEPDLEALRQGVRRYGEGNYDIFSRLSSDELDLIRNSLRADSTGSSSAADTSAVSPLSGLTRVEPDTTEEDTLRALSAISLQGQGDAADRARQKDLRNFFRMTDEEAAQRDEVRRRIIREGIGGERPAAIAEDTLRVLADSTGVEPDTTDTDTARALLDTTRVAPGGIEDQERFATLSHNISDRVPVDTMGRTSAQGGILDSSAPIILDSPDPDKIPDDEVKQVVEDITGKEDVRQDPIEEAMAIEQANAQERAIEEWSKGLGKTKGDKEVPEGMPSWLSPVLSGLGAYAGYKRGGGGLKGILSGALGGILGQYGGEALKGSPKIGEWIRGNPAKSALLAYPLLGEILGERGKQPTNYYQGYNPTSYGSMGMPGLQEGGVAGADSTLSLLERLMQGGVHPAVKEERAKGIPLWARDYASRRNPTVPRPTPMDNLLEALGRARPSYPSRDTPLPEMQAGGISGLDSLRTGLRDAIVNSIDDPNRQGVNSFVPSMLKAYDEIPKLQAGGIAGGASPNKPGLAVAPPGGGGGQFGQGTQPSGQPGGGVAPPPLTGANPGFIDPGKQAVRDLGYGTEKGGAYGQSGYGQMSYGTDPRLKKMNQGLGSALGGVPGIGHIGRGMGAVARQVAAPAIQQVQAHRAGVVPGAGTGAGQPVSDAMNLIGPGPGTTGQPVQNAFGNLGSGLASQIGQNIMEQRAAMGGLGSNMTEQQLAQGMMGGLAGLQGQEFGQRMGMAQFDQRERENMARYGLLGDQAANRPGYMSNIMRSIYA